MAPALSTATSKQYDAVVVTALLMQIKSSGGTINNALRHMSALDGFRTVSGFEHSLRALNKLAGELNAKEAKGEELGPEDMGNTAGNSGSPVATPRKRGGKSFPSCLIA
jgi:hypothetical protein